MKFKRVIKPVITGAVYNIEEFTNKAGEKFVYYDRIQKARQDTEIYPTLEKYGCLDPIMVNKEQMYLDLRGWKTDARSLTEMTIKADEMWNKLPHDIKAKFENNRDIFMRDGEKWLKSEIEKNKPAEMPNSDTTALTTTEIKTNE